jgi:hypothetical protein
MPISVTHQKVSAIADDPVTAAAGGVLPSDWNNTHTITADANTVLARAAGTSGAVTDVALSASQLLGRGDTGDVAPITLGTNLSMSGTTLNATGGGGSPAGSGTEVQYRAGGSFGAMAGTAWDNTNRALTITGATVTTSNPILNLTQTWNAGAVTFNGFLLNVTDTASAAGSALLRTQVGGSDRHVFLKSGSIQIPDTQQLSSGNSGINFNDGSGVAVGRLNDRHHINIANNSTLSAGRLEFFTSGLRNTLLWKLHADAANILSMHNSTNAQEIRVYGSIGGSFGEGSTTNFQRLSIRTVREVSPALSGATYTTTATIPAYAHLIGVTTRVNTAITGATSYSVGDGTDVDLWGATIPVAVNSESRTANFTAVAAVGAAAAARNVTLTANGSNFTGGVVEICFHFMTTEAD